MSIKYYVGNSDFNEVIIFYGLHADSFQMPEKKAKQQAQMREVLSTIAHTCPNFPYDEPLMIVIGVAGNVKDYSRRDVDNMTKTIFDAMENIVYTNDKLIHILLIQKQLWDKDIYGFEVGIRPINIDKPDKYTPIIRYSFNDLAEIGQHSGVIRLLNFSNEYQAETVFRSLSGDVLKVIASGETWHIVDTE